MGAQERQFLKTCVPRTRCGYEFFLRVGLEGGRGCLACRLCAPLGSEARGLDFWRVLVGLRKREVRRGAGGLARVLVIPGEVVIVPSCCLL